MTELFIGAAHGDTAGCQCALTRHSTACVHTGVRHPVHTWLPGWIALYIHTYIQSACINMKAAFLLLDCQAALCTVHMAGAGHCTAVVSLLHLCG